MPTRSRLTSARGVGGRPGSGWCSRLRAAATWRIVGLSLLALVALTALVSAIVRVLVFRPVSDMLAATKDLAHGGTPARR